MEQHFVVVYDTEADEFRIDEATTLAVLPDGPIYDPHAGQGTGWRMDAYEDGYAEVAAVLATLLAGERGHDTVR